MVIDLILPPLIIHHFLCLFIVIIFFKIIYIVSFHIDRTAKISEIMSKSYVIIEQPDKMAIYVVVLTKEGTATFWDDLSREIVGLHKPNTKVYFDYFFRNGLNNRVFSSHTDENGICSLAIEPIIDDPNFDITVFNGFHKLYDNYD